jgi:predicted N-formylglutamate amidohydrolase
MDRLAAKMLEITEAEKLLEVKRNDPFSKANREAHQ